MRGIWGLWVIWRFSLLTGFTETNEVCKQNKIALFEKCLYLVGIRTLCWNWRKESFFDRIGVIIFLYIGFFLKSEIVYSHGNIIIVIWLNSFHRNISNLPEKKNKFFVSWNLLVVEWKNIGVNVFQLWYVICVVTDMYCADVMVKITK